MSQLERRIGLLSVVAICLGAALGSGIFVLPGIASELTGPSVWLAYLCAGICILPAAVSKSELSTAMPTSGGTYIYLERTFGPLVGTIAGLGLWLSLLLKSTFSLVGFGAYLSVFTDAPVQYAALGLLIFIVGINLVGISKLSKAVLAIVTLVLVALGTLVIGGSFTFQPSNLSPLFPKGAYGLISATGFVFVAFAGVDKVAAIAEEVKDPGKNLPRGILLSLAIITTLYTGLSFVFVGNFEAESFAKDLKPVYTLAHQLGGEYAGMVAGILGVLTLTSMANVGVMAASRFPFAMARENLMPSIFAYLSPRFLTPSFAIIFSGFSIGLAIMLIPVDKVVKVASAFMLCIYIAENITVIVLRENRVQWYTPPYKSFLYPWLQIFGIITCAGILFLMGPIVGISIGAAIFVGGSVYLVYGRKQTNRKGVVGIRGRRQDLIEERNPIVPERDELFFFDQAAVVVSLFGEERSPEVLLELGAALAEGGKVEVVHLTEIPEQMSIDDISTEGSFIKSLRRRFQAMSIDKNFLVEFEPVVSHDIYKTVHEISNRLHCNWLVKEWGGRSRGNITIHNQMGWLEEHLACNVATFKDRGIRYFRKIMVYVDQGPHNPLIIKTCVKLAETNDAELVFVRWVPEEFTQKRVKAEDSFLREATNVFAPDSSSHVIQGQNELFDIVALTAEYDLLIMGALPSQSFLEAMFGSKQDKITEKAACSVLRIQTSGL
ncbi:amino acid permease [Pseudobacteriovorax antillogorgiicola]|uniref:Amino acid/polyamine/organocation transporter, APC superfamily n=1 Tax=Pseudobacteriovorax antillogorgiicola TaxID=1513793 RepID=A0A1Y6B6S0_9BACT|nr:amino acid permease [Pseudobacteriovorax antillogorgiicola]TCS58877.1 amino acid/polyamine/organocation transporter (APC superfamily) [Pseudobacteriovorax antillogorgiicola]SME93766.1 amino acid/polyamine/organocation transporter, APC superfamily [Pseudobacteriovorax antillogorgiicola]